MKSDILWRFSFRQQRKGLPRGPGDEDHALALEVASPIGTHASWNAVGDSFTPHRFIREHIKLLKTIPLRWKTVHRKYRAAVPWEAHACVRAYK